MSNNNRELSQFASRITVDDSTKNVSIASSVDLTGNLGIGTANSEKYLLNIHADPGGDNVTNFQVRVGGTIHMDRNHQRKPEFNLSMSSGRPSITLSHAEDYGTVTDKIRLGVTGDSYFNGSGDVGIGTDNPSEKLHTIGDVMIQGTGGTGEQSLFIGKSATVLPNSRGVAVAADQDSSAYHDMVLKTSTNSSGLVEQVRITSSGYLRLAGAGIQFNGDTAAANALDDYEEGTFSPSWANITGGSIVGQSGRYIKIGTLVWCVAAAKNNSSVSTADASTATFTLPFAPLQAGLFADYVQNIGTAYVGTAGGAGGGSSTNQSTYLAYNRNNSSTVNLRSGTVTIPIKGYLIITTFYNAAS